MIFGFRDEQGEVLAQMHTAFVLLDLKTRKITRITSDVIAPLVLNRLRSIERLASPKRLAKSRVSQRLSCAVFLISIVIIMSTMFIISNGC